MTAQIWLFFLAAAVPLAALLRSRLLVEARGVWLADVGALAPAARRTGLLRLGIAASLVIVLAFAAALVRTPRHGVGSLVPADRTTVIVLDMSASVSEFVYGQIATTLKLIVRRSGEDARVGLVLFSDAAQEALPPGTPVRELVPFIRFFEPKRDQSSTARPYYYRQAGPADLPFVTYIMSPWFANFAGGTVISNGLATAREMLERHGSRGGRVLLVSDLSNKESDTPALIRELVAYRNSGLPLDVVAVPPGYDATKQLAAGIGGSDTRIVDSTSLTRAGDSGSSASFPVAVAALIALMGILLAAHERIGAPLRWSTRSGP